MPFKKLHADIKEILESLEITTPTPFQSKSIPVIKSGANIYCTAPVNSGKTTTLVLTTLHKLKCQEVGSAPRALVLVENSEKALALHDEFIKLSKYDALRVYACDEREHIELLKSEIFEGVDVLIATPKTMNKLLLLEGVNTTQLKILSIDDASFLVEKTAYAALMAITQSIHKCQYVLYSEKMDPILKRFESYFMQYAKTVSVK
ncbi:DEAD/DEAH box helicase [Polaribacter sejongensis]|uniref:DEAD/DEAH box helicase n=1 Tax=Polaribacter sejongensis TaxID=985043 RepID=A0ABM6Q1Z2_9FLAO|nr:DEAD/DEAH box helicase [Polaribacter sejongensis]AUC23241.1 DEAD/DEAH box helicase [Polaribacter sejongensis]